MRRMAGAGGPLARGRAGARLRARSTASLCSPCTVRGCVLRRLSLGARPSKMPGRKTSHSSSIWPKPSIGAWTSPRNSSRRYGGVGSLGFGAPSKRRKDQMVAGGSPGWWARGPGDRFADRARPRELDFEDEERRLFYGGLYRLQEMPVRRAERRIPDSDKEGRDLRYEQLLSSGRRRSPRERVLLVAAATVFGLATLFCAFGLVSRQSYLVGGSVVVLAASAGFLINLSRSDRRLGGAKRR